MAEQSSLLKVAVCVGCGAIFGLALEKGRVHEPGNIRGQMDFTVFIMLKMFLSACAAGMAGMCILCIVSSSGRRKFQEARHAFEGCLFDKGMATAVIGGGLLGTGMTIAGACPGMVLAQVGSFTHNALYTLAGGFLGVLAFAVLEPSVTQLTRPSGVSNGSKRIGSDYVTTALPAAAMLGVAIFALEQYRPWRSEVSRSWGASNLLEQRSWPPYVSGAIIGLLQVPLILFVTDTLGSSSSYCTVLSQALVNNRLQRTLPYLARFRSGFGNWWQVWYVGGCLIGSYISASASGSLHHSSPISKSSALIGGALMLFGSRLAGGCTSGHGLSGLGLLSINSIVAVCSMFGGGILTKFAMNEGFVSF